MSRFLISLPAAAMLALAAAPCAAALSIDLHIELHAKAILRHAAEITVRDIATVESDDERLREGVERLKVGSVPRALGVGYIVRTQVERQIGMVYPEALGHISWSGPKRVDIRVAGMQVSGAEIDSSARAWLEESLRRNHEKTKVEVVSSSQPVTVPEGIASLRPRACGRETPARRMCVSVEVLANDALFRTIPVWFKVEAHRRVLVAKVAHPAGAAYEPGFFAAEVRDITALPGPALVPEDDPRAMRLKRSLAPGEVALRGDLEPIPFVVRNQDLTVKIIAGAILIEAPGVALSDGRLGSVIRVQNPSSKQIYRAQIVDQGVVTLNLR